MSDHISDILGFDFASETPPQDVDETSNYVITSLSQWEDALIKGVETRDEALVFACCSQMKKFKKTFPNKLQNKWVMSLVVDNFSVAIANRLVEAGATIPYSDKLFRQAAINNNVDALMWLKDQKVSPISEYGMRGAFTEATSRANLDAVEVLLTPRFLEDIGIYTYNRLLSEALIQKRLGLACQMMSISVIESRHKNEKKYNKDAAPSALFHFFTNADFSLSFSQCAVLQECLLDPKVAQTWDRTFPIRSTRNSKSVTCNDLIDVLLLTASPAARDIVLGEFGRNLVADRFKNQPVLLSSFLQSASAITRGSVMKSIAPLMSEWKDNLGRNVGHYMMSSSATKSSADEVYSLNKDWLLAEDNQGRVPLASASPEVKAYVTNKLARKVLSDHGVGLRQSHAPQRSRRM